MKKSFLMLGLAVAAMTSCTNDEVVEVNQSNLIKFESFVNKGTRAVTDVTTPTENGGLSKFYVFGYHNGNNTPDFANDEVIKQDDKWSYGTDYKYWTTSQYYFGAYADANSPEQLTNVSFADAKLTFTDYEVSDSKDLVAAIASENVTGLESAPGTVSLDFKHMLSKIQFTFTNKYGLAGVTMDISNLTISAIQKTGTCVYDGNDAKWTPSTTVTATVTNLKDETGIAIDATYSDNFFVIPQTISDEFVVGFKVTYKSGNEVVGEKSYSGIRLNNTNLTEWAEGYVYNYTADLPLSPNVIEFTATVTGWNTQEVPDTKTDSEEVEF